MAGIKVYMAGAGPYSNKIFGFGERNLVLKTPLPASARCRITNPPQGKPCVAFFSLVVTFKRALDEGKSNRGNNGSV